MWKVLRKEKMLNKQVNMKKREEKWGHGNKSRELVKKYNTRNNSYGWFVFILSKDMRCGSLPGWHSSQMGVAGHLHVLSEHQQIF